MSEDRQPTPARASGVPDAAIGDAVEALGGGGFVVHPTSTVYGIGGAATEAVDSEIARLKGRPAGTPLISLAPSVDVLRAERPDIAWDERADRLAAEFWPGSLTLVLVHGTTRGIAVRVDSHPVTAALLTEWGHLMSSTSLNPHGVQPCRDPEAVRAVMRGLPETERPIAFVDAGPLPEAPPSTVVSLLERPARVLRVGAVPVEDVQRYIEIEEVRVG